MASMDAYAERIEGWSSPSAVVAPSFRSQSEPERELKLSLAGLWHGLMVGEYVVVDSQYGEEQCLARLQRAPRPVPLKQRRAKTLQRVLLGESPKVIAVELGVALSSVTGACSDCLSATGAGRWTSRAPMWLSMAAHAGAGWRVPDARARKGGGPLPGTLELRCPRPDLSLRGRVTRAEYVVAGLYLQGDSHVNIASQCRVAPRTVANHLASVFRKLRVSGRGDLLSRLIREQWPQ
jgi:DNA-binding CsgD family transcriptional regulator